jgi:hypothetical protein
LSAYSDAVLTTSGLLNYWRCGNASGDGPDARGEGQPSIGLIGGVTHNAPGPLAHGDGGAFSFDGKDDCGVTELDLSAEATITVEFWLKWDAYAADDDLALEFTSNFNVFNGGFLIDPNNGGGLWGVGIGDSGAKRNNAFFASPSAGAWHHYAFVLDATAEAADQITPYVDGAPVEYTKAEFGTGQGNFLKANLNVMCRNGATLFGGGDLAHLAIYSGALSAETIAAHFAAAGEEGTVDVEPEGEEPEEGEGGKGGGGGKPNPNARPPLRPKATKYDAVVSSVAAIKSAANNPGNAGKVIAIKGGTYATLDFRGSGGHPPAMFGPAGAMVTFIPKPGEVVRIKGVEMRWTRNIRFEGIVWVEGGVEIVSADDFSNPAPFDPGPEFHNQNLEFYGCEWIGGAHNCAYAQAWTDGLLFEGCYFHDTDCPTGKDVGYGIQCSGGNGLNTDLTIRRCWFDHFANDMVQLSSMEGVVIDRNEFGNQERQNPSSHLDVCQLFGVKDVEVTNNYAHDGGIEQGFFFEFGWSGKCVVQNNLLIGSTTKKLWWSGNVVASGSILVDSNTVWDSNGCYIQAKGTAAFTVTNNIFDQYDVDHPEVIDEEAGNRIGIGPEFSDDHECTNFSQGYRLPTEIWWAVPPPPPDGRVAVTREFPPDKIAWRVADPKTGTTIARWAEDESKAENVISGITKSGEMSGGHKEAGGLLPRDPRVDYPDLATYLDVLLEEPGGEIVWGGRLNQKPESDGERMVIEPKAVGHQAALEDRNGLIGPGFIDCDLTKWGNPPNPRVADLGAAYKLNEGSTELRPGTSGSSALVLAFSRLANGFPPTGVVEAWYDSQGVEIGEVLCEVANYDEGAGGSGKMAAPWSVNLQVSDDDQASTVDVTPSLLAATPKLDSVVSTGSRKYAFVQMLLAMAFTADGDWRAEFAHLPVLGRHGLALQGEWPNVGFTAKQMLEYAIPLYTYLRVEPDAIEDGEYLISQAWFSEPGSMAAVVKELTKYELLDWFVMEDKVFQVRFPGTYGRRWQAYAGPSELKEAGEDGSRSWAEILVRYQDVDGSTRTVGPPGSGANVESETLKIIDPDHPAVKAGIPREDLLDLRGISTSERALEAGERWLQDANELSHAGEATLTSYLMDDKAVFRPVAQVQPGDWIRFPDAGSSGTDYRKIVVASYDHDSRTCNVNLDAPSEAIQALLERFQADLTPLALA